MKTGNSVLQHVPVVLGLFLGAVCWTGHHHAAELGQFQWIGFPPGQSPGAMGCPQCELQQPAGGHCDLESDGAGPAVN